MTLSKIAVLVLCLLCTHSAWAEENAKPADDHSQLSAEELKFFEGKIRPLLVKHCISCHGPDKQGGGLRLDLKTSAIEVGGESGPAVVPGHVDESMLIEAIRYESYEMPPEEQLSEEKIALFEAWVKMGAPWPNDTAEQAAQLAKTGITDEDRQYWAFQPLKDSSPPDVQQKNWSSQPIDRFVLARLEQENLKPAKPADKRDLLRRLYQDVIGLPPSIEQMQAFLQDTSPDAYEKQVDLLLASPQYGEHMGRIWLDLVRYAESDGYRQDAYRPEAWHYRDYVIQSFNDDKPYDRFVKEQLAGDELAPEDPQALIATAFLRHGVYEYNQRDIRTHWQEIVNEVTDVTGDVFLGLGMGCARCHNHKFDPILQEDYYGLRAFFTPMYWEDNVPLATPQQVADYNQKLANWEQATREIREQIDQIEASYLKSLADSAINIFPEDIQEMMRKPVEERSSFEHQLASLAWRQVIARQKSLKSKLKGDVLKRWEELQVQLDEYNAMKPAPLPSGPTVRDVCSQAPPTVLTTRRGEKEIQPHFPVVLTSETPQITPPSNCDSTGRRLALAEWLTRPEHPLTARVMVNRLWQQHFGKGLVASASDFGTLGDPPTHPELLDWLALRFIENGWSIKSMHRLMLLTETYQQSSKQDGNSSYEQAMLVDPQNRLLWRMNSHRLNADQIRDAILSATGEISDKRGGPSVAIEDSRRSVYTKVIRNNQHPFLTAFDAPRGTSSTSERNSTTTSTQALLMMNGSWILKRSEMLAGKVLSRHPLTNSSSDQLQAVIEDLYWSTLRRSPKVEEIQLVEQYFRQTEYQQEQETQSQSLLNFTQMPDRAGDAIDLTEQPQAPRPSASRQPLDGTSPFTIEAVVLLRSMYENASVRTIVAQWNNNQTSAGWSLGVTSQQSRYRPGNLILQLIGETADKKVQYEVIPSDIHLTLNNPYYVAVTVTPTEQGESGVSFYVKNLATNDPVEKSQVPHQVVKNFTNPQTRMIIGGRDSTSPQFWDGLIDQVRISNASLKEDDLFLNSEAVTKSTVADWNFEAAAGTLNDSSPARNSLLLKEQNAESPYQEAVTDIAHMLLNSNEFLYVD